METKERMMVGEALSELRLVPEVTLEAGRVIDTLYLGMLENGYKVGGPDPEVEAMDRIIFEGRPCRRCEGEMGYHSFHRQGSYRAFIVCPLCGWVKEV